MSEQKTNSIVAVKKVLEKIKDRVFTHIYYIACGGSSALMYPSAYLVDTRSKNMAAEYLNSNEFIYRNPAALNEKAVVILCSQEGKTPETVAAAKFATTKGATVITIAMEDDTPLEDASDFFVKYAYYETADMIDTSYGVMYLLTAGIIDAQDGTQLLEGMVRNLNRITPIVQVAKKQYADKALEFATACKDSKVIYSLSSGSDYSQSYVLCNCYMMEMQWINAIPIHAGEFFHGPFEIIEKDSPVLLLMGRDETRFLEERALKFCRKFTDNLFVIDTTEIDFTGIDPEYEGYMSILVLNNICRIYAKTIANVREHSLDIRRYMHLMQY
ncbi:MAG: SIS domain-containing protein [Ruthenibacterium sp.]